MPLIIVRGDITKMECDAIVNAANNTLLGGGGVDGAIHGAAGPELLKECMTLGGCETGQAKITGGYNLPARYIIHTVGPIWRGGAYGEKELLTSCYSNSLKLAKKNGCESIAFPLISSGVYGYPKDKAVAVATHTVKEFLKENDMTVYIVLYYGEALYTASPVIADVEEYINGFFPETDEQKHRRRAINGWIENAAVPEAAVPGEALSAACCPMDTLEELLSKPDESFSQMLLRLIDERGMKDSECYRRANVDRKLFSKIRSDIHYKPAKTTAIAFAIALELSIEQTRELLEKAGFALSHSSKFDIIVEYFIVNGRYDIFELNEVLFSFDQKVLC